MTIQDVFQPAVTATITTLLMTGIVALRARWHGTAVHALVLPTLGLPLLLFLSCSGGNAAGIVFHLWTLPGTNTFRTTVLPTITRLADECPDHEVSVQAVPIKGKALFIDTLPTGTASAYAIQHDIQAKINADLLPDETTNSATVFVVRSFERVVVGEYPGTTSVKAIRVEATICGIYWPENTVVGTFKVVGQDPTQSGSSRSKFVHNEISGDIVVPISDWINRQTH
jgi:hypothetical protein